MNNLHESLSRTVKMAMDTGEAATVEEAAKIFHEYRLAVEIGNDVASSPTLQASVLTAVNTACRCFLGGVNVIGEIDVPLLVPWHRCRTLSEAVNDLRGMAVPQSQLPPDIPKIVVGGDDSVQTGEFAIRSTFNGWAGGVSPLSEGVRLPERAEFTPAGVLAGALAVSEAFQYVRGGNPLAGRRNAGFSLWKPSRESSWLDPCNWGPAVDYLPSRIWLIGLGHLGQAFLWTLGFLPYAHPEEVLIVLQDFDLLSEANESTSPLTFAPIMKEKKTRAMARWCENRGFITMINERPFAGDFHINNSEPRLAICGVDNAFARADLEKVGFARVIEAGLGKGEKEYLAFQLHTFPGPQKAVERWREDEHLDGAYVRSKPAYVALEGEGMDDCGITTLAGRTVGASFVGVTVSTLLIAELLRMIQGGVANAVIDGTLRSPDRREVVANPQWLEPFNPGTTESSSIQ